MGHNRKLVFSGISLTMERPNRHDFDVADDLRDSLEKVLVDIDFFSEAPFTWIGLSLRFGLKNETEPHYDKIDKKDGELPIAIELDTHETRDTDYDELMNLYSKAVLCSLVHVAHKYDLPYAELEQLLEKELSVKLD